MKRWMLLLLLTTTPAAGAQEALRPTAVHGNDGSFLYGVLAGAASGDGIAVLTEPEPAVHLYTADAPREWGREGRGPAELLSPVDIAWENRAVHVLDIGNRKFVRFSEDGEFVASRGLGSFWARSLDVVAGDTILGAFIPMTDDRAVVRVQGSRVDTLLAYSLRGEGIRLEAEGAPSFTVKTPFSAQLRWTVAPDGGLIVWEPGSGELIVRDRDGSERARWAVEWEGLPVTGADREWWIANEIPEDFMGQRVFEPLRAVAREELEFPERHAAVLALESDPGGGVWVQRSLDSEGERWVGVGADGRVRTEVRLPVGRQLLAVGEERLFALATDELGVETVEVYGKGGG